MFTMRGPYHYQRSSYSFDMQHNWQRLRSAVKNQWGSSQVEAIMAVVDARDGQHLELLMAFVYRNCPRFAPLISTDSERYVRDVLNSLDQHQSEAARKLDLARKLDKAISQEPRQDRASSKCSAPARAEPPRGASAGGRLVQDRASPLLACVRILLFTPPRVGPSCSRSQSSFLLGPC